MRVSTVVSHRRSGWEPIFIGRSRGDPPYEERFSWEGRADKMTQSLAMCLLGYEYHVLSTPFLVHRVNNIVTAFFLKKTTFSAFSLRPLWRPGGPVATSTPRPCTNRTRS